MKKPEAPLFRDPIFDAPTDPVIIYNNEEKCWWMLYTQRRGNLTLFEAHTAKQP